MSTGNYNSKHGSDNAKMVRNILAVYHLVRKNEFAYENGLTWYPEALSFCASAAKLFGLEINQVAGIVAALSPLQSWRRNKIVALEFLERYSMGADLAGLSQTGNNLIKAARIYNGENPLDVLGGLKVRSFYRNIMLDDSSVTIDRHAASIALDGANLCPSGDMRLTSKLYAQIEQAYIECAELLGYKPYTLQAIVWGYKAQNGGIV